MFLAKVTIFIKVLKSLFVGIVYTNSYLLYKYLVKLGITQKKRLIIDIIVL
jgi:hypothetical protein